MRGIERNKENIERILMSTNRAGMDKLLEYMEENGFYTAPCSGEHHLCVEGGLAEHSLNVWYNISLLKNEFSDSLKQNIGVDSLKIVSLLHDLGKMGNYGKPNYVVNMVNTKTKNKETKTYDKVQSESKPFKGNPDLLYIPHEVQSLVIAGKFIELTEEEAHAIYYHNGKYTHIGYDLKETPLMMLLHFADLWSSRVTEIDGMLKEREKEEEGTQE